jgi:hypothetical protein
MFKKKLSEWSMLPAEVEVTHFYGTIWRIIIFLSTIRRIIIFLSTIWRLIIFLSTIWRLYLIFLNVSQRLPFVLLGMKQCPIVVSKQFHISLLFFGLF